MLFHWDPTFLPPRKTKWNAYSSQYNYYIQYFRLTPTKRCNAMKLRNAWLVENHSASLMVLPLNSRMY